MKSLGVLLAILVSLVFVIFPVSQWAVSRRTAEERMGAGFIVVCLSILIFIFFGTFIVAFIWKVLML